MLVAQNSLGPVCPVPLTVTFSFVDIQKRPSPKMSPNPKERSFRLRRVPGSVKRLVEGACAIKHLDHSLHVGHVPIVERLVEGSCKCKHTIHILHIGHVPIVERLVEGSCKSSAKRIICSPLGFLYIGFQNSDFVCVFASGSSVSMGHEVYETPILLTSCSGRRRRHHRNGTRRRCGRRR